MDDANGYARTAARPGPLPGAAPLYLFPDVAREPWWQALARLQAALAAADDAAAREGHAQLLGALALGGYADLRHAAAISLLGAGGPLDDYLLGEAPPGLLPALERDLTLLREVAGGDLSRRLADGVAGGAPPLEALAPRYKAGTTPAAIDAALAVLDEPDPGRRAELFLRAAATHGTGPAALYEALSWSGDALVGVAHPDRASWSELVGLDEQLGRLERNVKALLEGAAAHHTLLYGPRGSGKSTAVRGLLGRFGGRGLRLVEVTPDLLHTLPALVELLRRQPLGFVLFVDDLSFESADAGYGPLKSLLEGSLTARARNVLVLATSNRRHLVRERLSDRPAPEDDVHGWDTHNERLALADRFGLTITFPSASQRSYLELVAALAALRGELRVSSQDAIRFAEWGNGYSGRTARQYVDELAQAAGPRTGGDLSST